jgi:rubrerythrin
MPTRRALLAGAGAALVLPAVAVGRQEESDVEILERLLAIENRLVSAYEAALRRDATDPELGELLREQELEHIRGLEQALDEIGRRSPRAGVPPGGLGAALRNRDEFGRFALDLEAEARGAYADAAARIARPGLRQPLGSIMACEAAHEVALRAATGLPLLAPVR